MSRERERDSSMEITRKRKWRIFYLFRQIGEERGFKTEERVLDTFDSSIRYTNWPVWFINLRKAYPDEDARGIDFVFDTDVGDVYLQVKSSERGVKLAQKKHPDIPAVCIRFYLSDEEIIQICLAAVAAKREEFLALRQPFVIA